MLDRPTEPETRRDGGEGGEPTKGGGETAFCCCVCSLRVLKRTRDPLIHGQSWTMTRAGDYVWRPPEAARRETQQKEERNKTRNTPKKSKKKVHYEAPGREGNDTPRWHGAGDLLFFFLSFLTNGDEKGKPDLIF